MLKKLEPLFCNRVGSQKRIQDSFPRNMQKIPNVFMQLQTNPIQITVFRKDLLCS